MSKIVPFLWYNDRAEEAVKYYCSIFKKSKFLDVMRCGEHGPGPKGSVLTIDFQLEGQRFVALNGGPMYQFTPAISFVVNCKTQKEVDALWKKLSAGGEESRCGWLVDKFGVSWQIIPKILMDLLTHKDSKKAAKATGAMLKMTKINIQALKDAVKS